MLQILIFLVSFHGSLFAAQTEIIHSDLRAFLNRFETNPKAAMDEIPAKYTKDGIRVHTDLPRSFRPSDILSRDYITIKDQQRKSLCAKNKTACRRQFGIFAETDSANQVERFFPGIRIETKAEKVLSGKYSNYSLKESPWSGDYWPTYRMGISQRYADENYPDSSKYNDYVKFYQKTPLPDLTKQEELNILSPAEKYDLLMGDLQRRTLTAWNVYNGQIAYNGDKAETWVGICHGWAPAAYMVSRPKKSVSFKLPEGTELIFYPHDIKALVTQLWANTEFDTRFLGGRCNVKNPKVDDNGRVTDPQCFDINPAAWHLAVINEMGLRERSLVLDATYDFEVWNQPLTAYEVHFFNPKTKEVVDDFEKGLVDLADYTEDNFKKYRSRSSKKVVGVSMRLTYVIESRPNQDVEDSSENDLLRTVHYVYDLEFDEQNKIIGGEWYQNAHPDFIWSPYDDAKALSVADGELTEPWTDSLPPVTWKESSLKAAYLGQPLAGVIERLLELSQPQR